MIAEIIMWGFFSAIGWWGAQKLVIERLDPPPAVTQPAASREDIKK
jgi:hypothetical protein